MSGHQWMGFHKAPERCILITDFGPAKIEKYFLTFLQKIRGFESFYREMKRTSQR